MEKITCCNKTVPLKKYKEGNQKWCYYHCPTCNKKARAGTDKEAATAFNALNETSTAIKTLAPISNRQGLLQWAERNMPVLLNQAAQFIDKPATRRMIEKNIRYISNLSGYSWDKVWKSTEGQESISNALSEALYHAATLPEMGSIVPFGTTAEFIPSVECFKFGLETGKGAPFKDINIILIHENDQHRISQDKGNFNIKIEYGIPRGDIIAVAVHATNITTGKVIGEVYDVERLMGKAMQHSAAYRYFLTEKADFQQMKVEGKLKKDEAGREYYEKKISKRDGGSWDKKIYSTDITNPYDGPDRPEMLKKSAGKTFFRPYMKVRNAAAMADEWSSDEMEDEITRNQAADDVLKQASGQFQAGNNHYGADTSSGVKGIPRTGDATGIKDAEIIPDAEPQTNKEKGGEEKKDLKNNEGGLFNEKEIDNL